MLLRSIKVIVLLLCLFAGGAQAADNLVSQLLNVKINPSVSGAQLIVTLSREPRYRLMLLDAPARLVIDLEKTTLGSSVKPITAEKLAMNEIVANLRYGLDGAGGVRLVVEGQASFKIVHSQSEPLHATIWQLIIDLAPATTEEFSQQMALIGQEFAPKAPAESTNYPDIAFGKKKSDSHPFTIVLDAGHGGFDSGAEGVSGVVEKEVTLTFARTLQQAILKENPDFAVYLTRESDVFLRLNERVEKARDLEADLFISIHADSIHLPNVRGATVYTISNKASDALAKALADNENKADLLDGLPADEPEEVVDILLDLARRETEALSISFADYLIEHLNRAGVRLINAPHRYAGFMVLRAPEIPSVLVELGYLSNIHDETLIADPLWRGGVAVTMAQAIKEYVHHHLIGRAGE